MKSKVTTYQIGDLEIVALQATDPHGPHIIALHGYGSSAYELIQATDFVNVPPNTTWLFPNAPHVVKLPSGTAGRSWFSFDRQKVGDDMRFERYDEVAKGISNDISYSTDMIQDLLKRIPTPLDKVVIGGFSQGAILATHVALRTEEKLGGLAVFSGSVIHEDTWIDNAKSKAGLSFFQSHGEYDNVLSVNLAYRLEKLFKDAGMLGDLHVFQDGHTIPRKIFHSFSQFLAKQLG